MRPCVTGSYARSLQPGWAVRLVQRALMTLCLPLALCTAEASLAAPAELGRLFYTPAQRAQLESARAHTVTHGAHPSQAPSPDRAAPPLRFDGVVTRSDGKSTRWVDGKAQLGASGLAGLKPGQIRLDGRVVEPYQVLRPNQAEASEKESTP
jgi:hypothetical protein